MEPADRPPLLERVGLRFLERRAVPVGQQGAVHVLDPEERAALKQVETRAVLRAALAGALSASAAALADYLAAPLLGPDPDVATWDQKLRFFAIVGPVIVGAALSELSFLYWDALRSVDRLAKIAGLDLSPGSTDARRAEVAAALVRAALELPNPPRLVTGIDPRRESSKITLLLSGVLYKAKVSLTNFLLKALVRRLLGRSAVRAVLVLVAVPVSAAWDAIVCWSAIREARVRVLGPSAARELLTTIFTAGPPDLTPAACALSVRAVASAIVRSRDLHPNLVTLLRDVRERVGDPSEDALDDSRQFLSRLPSLAVEERRLVLRILAVAVIIDGKLARNERRLVREAQRACSLPEDDGALRRLRSAFLAGDAIPRELVLEL